MQPRVAQRRQVAAFVALAVLLLLVVSLVLFLLREPLSVLIGLVGLGIAGAGAWWAVTERMPRRAVGLIGALGGLAVIGYALALAVEEPLSSTARLVVVIVLLALASGAARMALLPELHRIAVVDLRGTRPRHPVLLCNPWSGGGKVERFGLVDLATALGVEVVMLDRGLDLEQLTRAAVARGADCLGMAGGDGSQALVASIAVEHDLPFVCVTAGTRNHFGLDLGLDRDDPRLSLAAFGEDAFERRIDYATVGDRFFVNNVSLGIYATIVQEPGYREAKSETTRARLPELLGRQAEPFDLQFTTPDGQEIDGAFLIQVSNNPYVIGAAADVSQRRRLDAGRLGVVAMSTRTGAEAARLMAMSALGQRRRSNSWHEFTATEFEVRSRSGSVAAGVDGEAVTLPTPMRFSIHERGLRLRVAAGNVEVAERRRTRDVDMRGLLTIATGHEPTPSA